MTEMTGTLIDLLEYLLPGLIAAWIYSSHTSFPKLQKFERVVQALIFTFIAQVVVACVAWLLLWIGQYWPLGVWTETVARGWSIVVAVLLGLTSAACVNNDVWHRFARRMKVTKQTSFPSEWFGQFNNNITFIVLQLKDERRIYGWPTEWPSDPEKGHFVLENPSWLEGYREIVLHNVDAVLVNVCDVQWVEFVKTQWETRWVRNNPILHPRVRRRAVGGTLTKGRIQILRPKT